MTPPADDRLACVQATLVYLTTGLPSGEADAGALVARLANSRLVLESGTGTVGWDGADDLLAHAHLAVYSRIVRALRTQVADARQSVDGATAVLGAALRLAKRRRLKAAKRAAAAAANATEPAA